MTRTAIRYGALSLVLAFVACGDEVATVPKAKKEAAAKATQAAAPQAAPVMAPLAYSPIGKRDPFQSYLSELRNTNAADAVRKQEATEEYELDQYRLTGIVTGTSQPRALVEDPGGKGHVVHIGTRLGKNGGVVTRITSTALVITQETRAPTGEKVRVPVTINLPAPELNMGTGQ